MNVISVSKQGGTAGSSSSVSPKITCTAGQASSGTRPVGQRSNRRGYTLLELVISTGAATVLLGGLMSTIVVANRAWSPDLKPAIKTEASGLTRQLSIDLKSALYFTERTSDAVTFAVPDRDSDGQPEILRYAWSGTAGDPLTVSLNGGAAQVVVADVQTFNMDYLLRSVIAPIIPTSGLDQSLVYISQEDGDSDDEVDHQKLSENDQKRIAVIESWGFTVSVVSGYASDDNWATAIDKAAAIYVPGSVTDSEISKRLYYANVGVVFESSSLRADSGFATQKDSNSTTDIDLENTFHYITSTLSSGELKIVKSSQPLMALRPSLGPDLEVLARSTSNAHTASLAVLEANARTRLADPVPARRVLLPWGDSLTTFDELTDAGLTIMERSISWAANLDDTPTRRRVLYFVEDLEDFDARDFDRKIMFESAGLEVRFLDDSSSSDVITDEISQSNAIYLAAHIGTDSLLSHVNNASQGLMTDGLDWTIPLGFSTGLNKANVTEADIKEKDHEIMDGFTGKSVNVTTGNVSLVTPGGDLAAGALTILETPGKGKKASPTPAVVVIEKGNQRVDDTDAPGRRTFIPYYNTLRSDLTEDGYQFIQQAMAWTANNPEVIEEAAASQSFGAFLRSFGR